MFTFRLPFFCLEELYDEVSALLNETYQKLIAPPEETPSVSDDSLTSWYSRLSSLFQALREWRKARNGERERKKAGRLGRGGSLAVLRAVALFFTSFLTTWAPGTGLRLSFMGLRITLLRFKPPLM